MKPRLDEKGVLHMPLALLAVVIVLTGFGLWGLLHRWKSLTETQLRLDKCTGEAALELKDKLGKVSSINDQMKYLRASEAAASAIPSMSSALKVAVDAEAIRQEAIQLEWRVKRGTWIAQSLSGSNCGSRGDRSEPLPALEWHRLPPDNLGAMPLILDQLPSTFHFEVMHSPRASAAEVFRGGHDANSFHARWIQPGRLLRPSLY